MEKKRLKTEVGGPNIIKLIRSVQRLEGNPDCFGKSTGHCDQVECAWREYCLGETESRLGPS